MIRCCIVVSNTIMIWRKGKISSSSTVMIFVLGVVAGDPATVVLPCFTYRLITEAPYQPQIDLMG